MTLYVLDEKLERIAVIDRFTSIIWTNRYYKYGDFELYLPANDEMIGILKENYFLVREGKEENAMIIEAIQINTSAEEGNYITVKGRCLKSILYRRIIWNMTLLTGAMETCIQRLINENIINPEIEERKIENFYYDNEFITGIEINAQYTGDNLGETVEAICESNQIGWDVILDLKNKKFNFYLYKGTDRSYNQKDIPYIVFSNNYENLLTTTYTYDSTEYKNVCKVAGEGEGLERKSVTVGNAKGMQRYEAYVDARDMSTNDGEISVEEYNMQLEQKGMEAISETEYKENFEGEVESNYTYKYEKDYYLGDIVEVENEYGMCASTRILETIESEDDSGTYTIPKFSSYNSEKEE